MENLIIFTNYSNQIPIILGMFGKENLEYQSKYDAKDFDESSIQMYYSKKLNSKIIFFRTSDDFIKLSNEYFNQFDKKLIFIDTLDGYNCENLHKKAEEIENAKKCFLWHYGEVFEKGFIENIKKFKYDFILSGSRRPELEMDENFRLDLFLPFRYFRYYIGFYYLEELINNIPAPKYNKEINKLFSYIRTAQDSGWRNEFIDVIKEENILEPKNSANDGYDLLYPKFKHFETINDYLYCNFNLVFETINYHNNDEVFLTEKTYKALFFGKPVFLIAPHSVLKFLKDNGFYLLNFEFQKEIDTAADVVNSFRKFVYWLKTQDKNILQIDYNAFLNKSLNNRKLLSEILNDYTECESIFQRLLNS
jgi:hypothetical protein